MLKTLYVIGLSSLLLSSCKPKEVEMDFPEPNRKDVKEIVSVLMAEICQDTFMMKIRQPLFVSDSLYRRHLIYSPDSIRKYDVLNFLINDKRYLDTIPFSIKDSAYLVAQEKMTENFNLDTIFNCLTPKPHAFLSNKAQKLIEEKPCCYTGGYYTFSIPIFSRDNHTAIIYRKYHGFQIDSFNEIVYILKKDNQNWKIVKTKMVGMA